MCKCTPEIRTPFCGKPGCEAPEQQSSKERVASFLEWLDTPEGKAAIAESERVCRETEELLAKGRDIPWEKLHEPFTI